MALLTGNGDPFFDFLFPSKLEEEIPGRLIINDVLINILSKLPIKSLLRFKCVSKEWQSFISDPSLQEILPKPMSGLFVSFYTSDAFQISLSLYTFVLVDGRRPNCNNAVVDFGDLSFFPRHDEISIVDCCNGLVLGLATQGINSTFIYYVINPATKKWAAVPVPNKERLHAKHLLAFDPRASPHYTLICTSTNFPEIDIFSSKKGVWAQFKLPQELVIRQFTRMSAVFLNRTLHMLSDHHFIVGFDVDGECFRSIPLPGVKIWNNLRGIIGVSGGYLHYANHDGFQLQIWMLEDYDELKWVLKHKTTLDSIVKKHPQAICSSSAYDSFHDFFIGNNLVEMPESDHLPFWMYSKSRYLKETSSNENMNENMNVGVPYYQFYFSLVAFHPDFEVILLQTGGVILSYHFNNMDLKVWVSKPDYFGDAYPFSPCLADFYGCEWR